MTTASAASATRGARRTSGGKAAKVAAPQTVWEVYVRLCQRVYLAAEYVWDHLPWRVQAGIGSVLVVGLLWVGHFAMTLAVLLAVLAVAGFAVWHQRHREMLGAGTLPGGGFWRHVTPHKVLARALLRPLVIGNVALWSYELGWMPTWAQVWPFSVATALVVAYVVWRELPEGADHEPRWTDHEALVDVIFHPRVIKWTEDTLPKLQYLGPPRTDEFGTAVMVGLPGLSWTALAAKHSEVAALLRVPRRVVTITPGGREYGEHVVRLWVGTQVGDRQPEPSPLADNVETRWHDPLRVGKDMRGRLVTLLTTNVHTLLVAKTRAGKTWLARIIGLHALRDPEVDVWMLNGKDKRSDWRAMAPACVRYVAVDDADDLDAAFSFLADLRALCKARKDADYLRPVVVFLEEWRAVRGIAAAISPAKLRELDSEAASLGAVASGYGVHIVGLAQRGTADYVAMGLKANMTQRAIGMTTDASEAEWAMGFRPQGELPSVAGEFLVQMDEDQPTLTQVDMMPDDVFAAACAQAIDRRRELGRLPEQQRAQAADELADIIVQCQPEHVVEVPQVTLEGCVKALLADHGHLSSTELLGELPAAVAPTSREVLGRLLGDMDGVQQRYVGSKRGWRLTGGASMVKVADQQQAGVETRSAGVSVAAPAALAVQP